MVADEVGKLKKKLEKFGTEMINKDAENKILVREKKRFRDILQDINDQDD